MINKTKVRRIVASKNKKKLPKFAEGDPDVNGRNQYTTIQQLQQPQYMATGAKPAYDPTNPTTVKSLETGTATGIGQTSTAPTGLSNSQLGGIGGIASGIGGMMKTPDASSSMNYAGDMLGNAGTGAQMGAQFGPWGTGIGAVAGAAYGLIDATHAEKMQNRANNKTQINTNLDNDNSMSNQVNSNYNLRNMTNDRVPGLSKGTALFKSNGMNPNQPNAMVAGQEGIADGQTGRVGVVPGQYSPSNPDNTPANLTQGSSVFSKKKSQIIPGGKSTPADVIARATRAQNINDKILNPKPGQPKSSKIDQLTAQVNQRNIQNQVSNLNKYNTLVNPQQQGGQQLPRYNNGSDNTTDNYTNPDGIPVLNPQSVKRYYLNTGDRGSIKYLSNEEGAANPNALVENSPIDANGYIPGTKYKVSLPSDKSMYSISDATKNQPVSNQPASNVNTVINTPNLTPGNTTNTYSADINVGPGETIAGKSRKLLQSKYPNATDAQVNKSTADTFAAQNGIGLDQVYQPGVRHITFNTTNLGANTDQNYNRLIDQVRTNTGAINQNLGTGNGMATTTPTMPSTSTQNPSNVLSTNGNINDSLGVMKSDFDPMSTWSAPKSSDYFTPTGINSNQTDINTNQNTGNQSNIPQHPKFPGFGNIQLPNGDAMSSFGNKLMSLAPMAYNAWNATPEVASPQYNNFVNPNQRYNIAPELSEATKQRQITRYGNANLNTSTGANMQYGADQYSRGQDQLSGLMGKAQMANNQYRNEYATRQNQQESDSTNENRRIYDVNARNRAAARTFGAANANMLSQYGQTQQLMGNQKKADALNSNIWAAYATAVNPQEKAYFKSLIDNYTK